MRYYKITSADISMTVKFNQLVLWLSEYEYDEQNPPEIETIDMTEEDFNSLPKFEGF